MIDNNSLCKHPSVIRITGVCLHTLDLIMECASAGDLYSLLFDEVKVIKVNF